MMTVVAIVAVLAGLALLGTRQIMMRARTVDGTAAIVSFTQMAQQLAIGTGDRHAVLISMAPTVGLDPGGGIIRIVRDTHRALPNCIGQNAWYNANALVQAAFPAGNSGAFPCSNYDRVPSTAGGGSGALLSGLVERIEVPRSLTLGPAGGWTAVVGANPFGPPFNQVQAGRDCTFCQVAGGRTVGVVMFEPNGTARFFNPLTGLEMPRGAVNGLPDEGHSIAIQPLLPTGSNEANQGNRKALMITRAGIVRPAGTLGRK